MLDPTEYLNPRTVRYALPQGARAVGVQLRWWQPRHGGSGRDQWALDHVQTAP